MDKQVAAVVPILLEHHFPVTSRRHMLQLFTHVPTAGVDPGGQVLTSSVISFLALAGSSVLENLFPPLEQPCTVLHHMLRFFPWSPRRFQTWGL